MLFWESKILSRHFYLYIVNTNRLFCRYEPHPGPRPLVLADNLYFVCFKCAPITNREYYKNPQLFMSVNYQMNWTIYYYFSQNIEFQRKKLLQKRIYILSYGISCYKIFWKRAETLFVYCLNIWGGRGVKKLKPFPYVHYSLNLNGKYLIHELVEEHK